MKHLAPARQFGQLGHFRVYGRVGIPVFAMLPQGMDK